MPDCDVDLNQRLAAPPKALKGQGAPGVLSEGDDEAALCIWRVFAIHIPQAEPEAVEDRVYRIARGPREGDSLTVTIGKMSARFLEAMRAWRAEAPLLLGLRFGRRNAEETPEEWDELVRRAMPEVSLDDLVKRDMFWMTFALERPAPLASGSDSSPAATDPQFWQNELNTFESEASPFLDLAVTDVYLQMGQVVITGVTYNDNRAFLLRPGQRAIALPHMEMSGTAVARGVSDVPIGDIDEALRGLPSATNTSAIELSGPRRWLLAAIAEPIDVLRQFLFSFVGLESLVTKISNSRSKTLIESLGQELGGLPLEEVAWPHAVKEPDMPWRNLTFHFACTAIFLSNETAAQDVDLFRVLAKARNRMAHGSTDDIDQLPAAQCRDLLARYVGLAVAAGEQI